MSRKVMDKEEKATAKKGAEGDREAALTLVMLSPHGSMKKGEDPVDFSKRVNDSDSYEDKPEAGDDMPEDPRIDKLAELISCYPDDPKAAAKAVMEEMGRAE